jgi:hypothetical protein
MFSMCLPLAGNLKVFAIDTRFVKAIPGSNIMAAGRHRYTVVEQTRGMQRLVNPYLTCT